MSVFLLSIKGQIEKATFPDFPELFIKYQFVYGDDWIVTTGIEEGITQVCRRYDNDEDFIFNFPVDITFKSTNPRGWPQIVLCAYGRDTWGKEVIRGYGSCFAPLSLGSNIQKMVGMFVPDASNIASKLSTLISGRPPELYDPRILTRNRGREVLRTNSQGCIQLVLSLVSKDGQRMGYSLSSQEKTKTVDLPFSSRSDNDQSSSMDLGPAVASITSQFDSMQTTNDRGEMSQSRQKNLKKLRNSETPHDDSPRDIPQTFSPSTKPALSPRVTVVRRLQEEKDEQEGSVLS